MITTIIKKYIEAKLHPAKIHAAIDKTITSKTIEQQIPKPTRVACVQRTIQPVDKVEDFVCNMFSITEQASANGAMYIIFPEYNFFDLLGIIPGFTFLNNYLNKQAQPDVNNHNQTEKNMTNNYFYSILDLFAKQTELAMLTMMTRFATIFQVYIFTGTYIHKQNNNLYNQGALIEPDGTVHVKQAKVHLTDFEDQLGLSRENIFRTTNLPIGNMAIPICMDASYFETFKLLEESGADIVIMPIANNEPYNKWKALRGIWPRVQESYVFGLKSALTGHFAGMHFTGKAGGFAAISMTEKMDGIIAISKHPEGDEIVYADLDFDALYQARKEAEYYGDVNKHFEAAFYEKTYPN